MALIINITMVLVEMTSCCLTLLALLKCFTFVVGLYFAVIRDADCVCVCVCSILSQLGHMIGSYE